jgi:hypothetical protein
MKYHFLTIGALAMAISAMAASTDHATNKLSLTALQAVNELQYAQQHGNKARAKVMAQETVGVLFKVSPSTDENKLNVDGLEILTRIGNIVVANIPVSSLSALADYDVVKAIDLAAEAQPELYHTRAITHAAQLQGERNDVEGYGALSQQYFGKGVVVGLLDTGLDPNHINFFRRPDFKESRVKAIYTMDAKGITGEYTTPEAIAAFTTENANQQHGTHVLGIMAGAYNGTGEWCDYDVHEVDGIESRSNSTTKTYLDGTAIPDYSKQGCCERIKHMPTLEIGEAADIPYSGIAPESDIVICAGTPNSTTELLAAQKVIEYAESVNKPCVINFSLGMTFGSRDGKDPWSEAIAELGKRAIICISAGNNGSKNCWLVKNCTAADNKIATLITPNKTELTALQGGALEMWSSNDQPFTLNIFAYEKDKASDVYAQRFAIATVDASTGDNTTKYISSKTDNDADGCYKGSIEVTSGVVSYNNRYSLKMKFSTDFEFVDDLIDPAIGIEVVGKDGQRIDITADVDVMTLGNLSNTEYAVGTPDLSINHMSCANNVFSVGSVINRNIRGALHNTDYSLLAGNLNNAVTTYYSTFSAYGTLVDGRTKPDIAAPGQLVASSNSTYYNNQYTDYVEKSNTKGDDYTGSKYSKNVGKATVDGKEYWWTVMSGTSMSSPAFAGVCALWLEANPDLTYQDVYDIMVESAQTPKMKGEGTSYAKKVGGKWDDSEYDTPLYESTKYRYGAGNVDAYAGLKLALKKQSGIASHTIDESKIMIQKVGDTYEVTVGGDEHFNVSLVSLSGRTLASNSGDNTVSVSTANLAKGVYILTAKNAKINRTAKIVVK